MKIAILFVCLSFQLFGQIKFDQEELAFPQKYGEEVAGKLNTKEVFEFQDTAKNCVYLKNGFRTSKFVNEQDWTDIQDTVEVYRVDIVYSKYPLRKGQYHEIYPLLFSRLNFLFEMDASLNDVSIEWNKVLQTNCINDQQVNTLFHGVVIWYRTNSSIDKQNVLNAELSKTDKINKELEHLVSEQNSLEELKENVEFMLSSPFLPDSIKSMVSGKSLDDQIVILNEYYKKDKKQKSKIDLKNSTPEEFARYQKGVDWFCSNYKGFQPVVTEVFDRHPEWKSILVVNDWTGSMYGYGAQVLQWHILNIEKSEIISMTLFNDGDHKASEDKLPGETEGIYTELADNVPDLVDLFNYVMLQGSGGDGPENDIEAILAAVNEFENFSEIVLIADNNACVRDIELADRIGKPVRIILCGYDPKVGINPHYVYLAKITGGGIYTIEEDLENLQLELDLDTKGEVKTLTDDRFIIRKNVCGKLDELMRIDQIMSYEYAKRHKKKIRKLDLSSNNLAKIPNGVFKMKKLNYLDVSHNELKKIPPSIEKLSYLKELNLSHNQLSFLPEDFTYIRYLEVLNLSHNEFKNFPNELIKCNYLTILDFSHNQLSEIGPLKYARIVNLNLSYNSFTEIPKSIYKLKTLRKLDLSNNSLSKVPDRITALRKLNELDLSNNSLTALPTSIHTLSNLVTLNLAGNSFSEAEKERIRKALPLTKVIF